MAPQAGQEGLPSLGSYDVLEKIGEGSMAAVYLGYDRANETPVAIKVPLPEVVNNPILLQRFEQEYRVGSALDHPNIVRTLDFGNEGGLPYLVQEFVEGEDLWRRIEVAGRLPEEEAVEVIVQAARGVYEAHKHGVIHRDIKPDNILITADGQAKLGDLGLIKDLEGELQLTRTRKGLGTPNFMAPEQFNDARNASFRCDIYGLGATLYMAVTGELPFVGRSLAATLRKKTDNDLVSPRQLVRGLSDRVEWAVRRAVQADPQRRHASCLEFIQALTGADAGAAPSAAPPPNAGARRHAPGERRGRVRYPFTQVAVLDLNKSIHDGASEARERIEGTLQDLSLTGAGLVLSRRFEPGTMLTVLLETSDGRHKQSRDFRVARVAQIRGGRWFVGGSFVKPLEKKEIIKLL